MHAIYPVTAPRRILQAIATRGDLSSTKLARRIVTFPVRNTDKVLEVVDLLLPVESHLHTFTQRCNVSAFFYAKICSLLARRQSSQPVQRVYWPENVIDWLGKWRPTCVMRHARGQKLQSFRRKWPFYIDLYSMPRPTKKCPASG